MMSLRQTLVATSVAVLASLTAYSAGDLAVRGELVYPVTGEPIEDGVVIVRDGKIRRVGPASRVRIPNGFTVIEAVVVTPGLVDARSTLGLSGVYGGNAGQVRDQDQLELSAPLQPELRAEDAYNPADPLIDYVRGYGVTTMHTGHGPGAVVSGQTMIVKTVGDTVDEALVRAPVALAVSLGRLPAFESPGTSAKSASLLRAALIKAREYDSKRSTDASTARDLASDALVDVLRGETFALVNANRSADITTAFRIADEFDIRVVIDGGAEAYRLADELIERDIAVFLHPPSARGLRGAGDSQHGALDSAARLAQAGVRFAIETGFEPYVPKTHVLLFEAALAAGYGLSFDETLAAVTIEPARLLGIDDRVGSLERGKDGDLVLFSGDPFEYTSQVCAVVIEGVVVEETCR